AALRKDEAAPLPPPPAQQAAPAPYVQQFAGAASLDGTAGNLSALNARLLFYGNAPAQAEKKSAVQVDSVVSPAPNLGVRWSILRKRPGGEFAEVGPETVLDSGEAVRLKLVPNNHGRLSVWEAGPN